MNETIILTFIIEARKVIAQYFESQLLDKNIKFENVYPMIVDFNDKTTTRIGNIHDELGKLYETMLPTAVRKDYGRFYTNDENIIDTMVNECDILSGKILEPACGTGLFLVKIVQKIIKIMKSKGTSAVEIANYIIDNVYGNDIDKTVLNIAEINVLSAMMPVLIDAINENETCSFRKLKLSNIDFTQKNAFEEKFSLIIGNPPFVTLYGKRSRNMNEEKRAYYNTFDFVQNKAGNNKFNLCMFFVENGLKQLTINGSLYYILDISFFETAFIDLRKYIVQNYYINSITKGLNKFEDVASGQLLIRITNRSEANKQVIFNDLASKTTYYIDQKIWNNAINKYKYTIPFDGLDKIINEKVKRFQKLDYFYPQKALRTCCALTGRTEDFIVNPYEDINLCIYPYIEGSKGLSVKFGSLTALRYIKYDYDLQIKISEEFKEELTRAGVKNKKRVTLGDKAAYDAPKIFIRQSAFEIITTYTEEPYAANNSIYILSNKDYSDTGKKMLKYICGILNSDLTTYYCRINNIIRFEKGKTPQIKTSDLKDIRICYDKEHFEKIVRLVNTLLMNNGQDSLALEQLNKIVYKIYGISEIEADYISEYIKNH